MIIASVKTLSTIKVNIDLIHLPELHNTIIMHTLLRRPSDGKMLERLTFHATFLVDSV